MRNLHNIIRTEFEWENVIILRRWDHLEKKIANFSNHRRFTLRCMSQKITPSSLKLKTNIKTHRGRQFLQGAEKQLADECIRAINNTIDTCTWLRDTCMNELKGQINDFYFKECCDFISRVNGMQAPNHLREASEKI